LPFEDLKDITKLEHLLISLTILNILIILFSQLFFEYR